jgi:hypothetical protein
VACDILRMSKDDGLCDDYSKLHLYGYPKKELDGIQNKKSDANLRDLTEAQLEEINRALEEYDCGVWQHLQKYQAKGTLRILHPSEHLFATCNPEGSKDISFLLTIQKVEEIARRRL